MQCTIISYFTKKVGGKCQLNFDICYKPLPYLKNIKM